MEEDTAETEYGDKFSTPVDAKNTFAAKLHEMARDQKAEREQMPTAKSVMLVERARQEIAACKLERLNLEAIETAQTQKIEAEFDEFKRRTMAQIEEHARQQAELTDILMREQTTALDKVSRVIRRIAEEIEAIDQQVASHETFIASMAKDVTKRKPMQEGET